MAGLLIKEASLSRGTSNAVSSSPLEISWNSGRMRWPKNVGFAFDILLRDQIEASLTGNPFIERNRLLFCFFFGPTEGKVRGIARLGPDYL